MANYGINIDVKIKAGQLTNFNKLLDNTNKRIDAANKNIQRFASLSPKHIRPVSESFNNLTMMVNKANAAFNKSTLGTPQAVDAARNLVRANDELNIGLQKRTKLLEQITVQMNLQKMAQKGIRPSTMFASPIGPGQATSVFSGRVKQNIAASQAMRQGGFASFSSRADQVTETAKIEAVKNKARDRHLKNIDKKVAKIATIQTQQQAQKAFAALPGGSFGIPGGQIGPRLPLRNRLGFGKNAKGGPFSMPGGVMGRIKGGFGSGLIGGGFPLLFGAGGLSSVMGGVAGAAGGALAPGGGFAASIAATALAAQIEKIKEFRKSVKLLNKEVILSGETSEFSRQAIKNLAKDLDITNDEAVKLASTFAGFGGETGEALIRAFGSREVFNSLSGLRDTQSVLSKISELRNQIGETGRKEALQVLATEGSLKAQLFLQERILNRNRQAVKLKAQKITGADRRQFLAEGRTDVDIQNFIANRVKTALEQFDSFNQKQLDVLQEQIKINEQMQFLVEFQAPTDQLREMLNPMRQILDLSVSIRDGFEESFKGIIKGTMTVQEAFRSMLNRIADHFLDTAARMAATQIQKGFLGLFSNMFNFSNLVNDAGNEMASQGSRIAGSRNLGRRADGGPVRRGNSFIVGERGPELFSPGVSGMITPNEMLGGGSTNIVVNVDASGSSVEGDEQGGRELGRVISAAVQSELIQQKRPGGLLA